MTFSEFASLQQILSGAFAPLVAFWAIGLLVAGVFVAITLTYLIVMRDRLNL